MRKITRFSHHLVIILFNIIMFSRYGGSFFNFFPVTGYAVILLLLLFFIILQTKSRFYLHSSYLLIGILVSLLLFSLAWTHAPLYGVEKLANLVIALLIFYLITPSINKHFQEYLFVSVFFFFLYLINLYFVYGSLSSLVAQLSIHFRLGWGNDTGVFFHPIGISRYITFSLINSLFLLYVFVKKKKIILSLIIVFLILYGTTFLFFSGTRSPILAIILAFSLFFLLNRYTSKKIKIIIIVLPIFLLGVLTILLKTDFGLSQEQKSFVEYRFDNPNAALDDRGWQLQRVIDKFSETYMLQGRGIGDFGYEITHKDTRIYPHNIFSELFFENGFFAVFILLILMIYIFSFNRSIKSTESKYFIIIFYYFFVNSLFSGDLSSNSIVFGYFVAVVSTIRYQKKRADLKIYSFPKKTKNSKIYNQEVKGRKC